MTTVVNFLLKMLSCTHAVVELPVDHRLLKLLIAVIKALYSFTVIIRLLLPRAVE